MFHHIASQQTPVSSGWRNDTHTHKQIPSCHALEMFRCLLLQPHWDVHTWQAIQHELARVACFSSKTDYLDCLKARPWIRVSCPSATSNRTRGLLPVPVGPGQSTCLSCVIKILEFQYISMDQGWSRCEHLKSIEISYWKISLVGSGARGSPRVHPHKPSLFGVGSGMHIPSELSQQKAPPGIKTKPSTRISMDRHCSVLCCSQNRSSICLRHIEA